MENAARYCAKLWESALELLEKAERAAEEAAAAAGDGEQTSGQWLRVVEKREAALSARDAARGKEQSFAMLYTGSPQLPDGGVGAIICAKLGLKAGGRREIDQLAFAH